MDVYLKKLQFLEGMTVRQNIVSVLETVEKDKEKIKSMLEEALIEFSVSHLRRVLPLLFQAEKEEELK